MYVHTRVRERNGFGKYPLTMLVYVAYVSVRLDGSGKRVKNVNGHAWVDGD